MPLPPELTNYVANARGQGIADAIIRNELLKVGWKESDVSEALQGQISGTVPTSIKIRSKSHGVVIMILIIILIAAVGIGGYYILNSRGNTPISENNSIQNNASSTAFPEDKKLAENYKTDLNEAFSKTKASSLYLIPKLRDLSDTLIPIEQTSSTGISFSSPWGKPISFTTIGGNKTFKFDYSRSINFYKHDESSALIKTLEKAMTATGWSYPRDFTEPLQSFLIENKISTIKDLIDYSLAINPLSLLTDSDDTRMIINYSLLQQIKRTLIDNDIVKIDRFKTNSLEGYIFIPDSAKSNNVGYLIFTTQGSIYSASMYSEVFINGSVNDKDGEINTILSTLKIDN